MKKKLILAIFLLSGYVVNVESKEVKVKADAAPKDDIFVGRALPLDNEIIGSIIGALLMDVEFLEALQKLAGKFQDTVETKIEAAKIEPERREAFVKAHPKVKAAYDAFKKVAAAKK